MTPIWIIVALYLLPAVLGAREAWREWCQACLADSNYDADDPEALRLTGRRGRNLARYALIAQGTFLVSGLFIMGITLFLQLSDRPSRRWATLWMLTVGALARIVATWVIWKQSKTSRTDRAKVVDSWRRDRRSTDQPVEGAQP